jgi:predicted membrane protein (TIGR00267 family)
MAFMPWVREKVELLQHYHRISEVGEIVRRYFALNAFDGVLTTLGVLVGAYLGGVESRATVVTVVLTTAVGMSVSGFYGSYLIEKAERDRGMRELEESTLSSLEDTDIASASRYATILIAVVDGASPFVAAIICLIPFLFINLGIRAEYIAAMATAFLENFLLGVFLGRVSRQRWVVAGLKFTGAAFIALVISVLIERRIGP